MCVWSSRTMKKKKIKQTKIVYVVITNKKNCRWWHLRFWGDRKKVEKRTGVVAREKKVQNCAEPILKLQWDHVRVCWWAEGCTAHDPIVSYGDKKTQHTMFCMLEGEHLHIDHLHRHCCHCPPEDIRWLYPLPRTKSCFFGYRQGHGLFLCRFLFRALCNTHLKF